MTAMGSAAPAPALTGPLVKPRLRGWFHAYAAAISVATGVVLVAVAAALRGPLAGWSTSLYALTVTGLFGISAFYHRGRWSPAALRTWKRLDHSMIFVFIAGTYTPISLLTMPRDTAIMMLTIVWSGALLGVGLQWFWPGHPRWLSAPCYIALGWVAIFVVPDLLHKGGAATLILILVGGLFYSSGAVIYATKRPNPAPKTFGFHELFHLFTLFAAICHYIAIWFAVFS
ncbi:channel protein (hemolysin III family) [Jatrophihabitans sp. GAS493]|uniref:PAQR family membrane homeostasis protein TrhA n=1 Tax=Jatrophihabitans sp. GAS493 TaxID=1907575 RepID=UPI000BC042EB|nr:hemolysin III family protein [Jatrophihabitans sp. GAS493]SOD75154.1 channel protein (hemolysin III family) [Jatrophihabitans sp. GAS493]